MYGTRDVAQHLEREYSELMQGNGFERGTASLCALLRRRRNIRIVVHGDDFTVLRREGDIDWFRKVIGRRYSVKCRARL